MKESDKYPWLCQLSFDITLYVSNISPSVCDFIACQFALESDFGSSYLAQHYNNYCGMKNPKRRISFADQDSIDSNWAKYSDRIVCIMDYFLLLRGHPMNYEDVYQFAEGLKGWYCPDSDYIDKIFKIYYKYFKSNNKS